MPAHDKHSKGNANETKTYGVHIPEILRCEVKRIGTKIFHENSPDGAKKSEPENKQNLVPPEMKE